MAIIHITEIKFAQTNLQKSKQIVLQSFHCAVQKLDNGMIQIFKSGFFSLNVSVFQNVSFNNMSDTKCLSAHFLLSANFESN